MDFKSVVFKSRKLKDKEACGGFNDAPSPLSGSFIRLLAKFGFCFWGKSIIEILGREAIIFSGCSFRKPAAVGSQVFFDFRCRLSDVKINPVAIRILEQRQRC